MAHHKRKRPRSLATRGSSYNGLKRRLEDRGVDIETSYHFMRNYPRYWDIIRHSRPARQHNAQVARMVVKGDVDADDAIWMNGRKPHIYYW